MPKVDKAGKLPPSIAGGERAKPYSADKPFDVESSYTRLFHLAFWTTKHVAEYLGCSEVAVRSWRSSGIGPEFIRVTPRQVRYRPEVIQKWLEARTASSTSTPTAQAAG